ncbi:MAG: DUF4038 domain-containing protein [Alistipes sp.]|nr:DUF4038 domain-containing protein [Alistipes sp.]
MKLKLPTLLLFAIINTSLSLAQHLERITVSENHHFLQYDGGKPFFYTGDTAWELFHRTTREEADLYLQNRASKGFNVIQAVALSECDGIGTPNSYGHLPLIDRNPAKPATTEGEENDYWDHVDYVVKKANSLGNVYRVASHLG